MLLLLDREHLDTKQEAQYFDIHELEKQTGQPASNFGNVILKELVDNALDACESAGLLPDVTITTGQVRDSLVLMVTDNAGGIPPHVIDKILDFSIRTSSNAAYKSPTRGAQGNALKTVIGISHVFNGRVQISSQGFLHTISTKVTPDGSVSVRHERLPIEHHTGTRFVVTLSSDDDTLLNVEGCAYATSLFNPHCNVKTATFEKTDTNSPCLIQSPEFAKTLNFYMRTTNDFKKHKPCDPTSIHWYEKEEFYGLAYRIATQTGQSLSQFIRSFHGLSATNKAKEICLNARIIDIDHDEAANERLFNAMVKAAKPVKQGSLGFIGEAHFLERMGCPPRRHWYKKAEWVIDNKPYLFEVFIGAGGEGNTGLYHGINHSPSFNDFIQSNTLMVAGEIHGMSITALLDRAYIDMDYHFVAVHLISPSLAFLDRGKTRLSLPQAALDKVANTIWLAGKERYKEGKRREKDADRTNRYYYKENKPVQRDTVLELLPEAISLATSGEQYPANARNVYYKVRALCQQYGINDLDYNYFSAVLKDYWLSHGRHPLIFNDPRGLLYHPHDDLALQLGTFQVRDYELPEYQFNKILYIEKKGLWPTIEASGIHKHYDMAVVAGEGYSTEAIRELLAMASNYFTLFCLHDADIDGYNIARTLKEATKSMPNHSIDVIDIGLTIEQAESMALLSESFTRKKALPALLELTPKELEYFTGEASHTNKTGQPDQWTCKRYELNAMDAKQLIDLIEQAIVLSGAALKVIPDQDAIDEECQNALDQAIDSHITEWFSKRFDMGELKRLIGNSCKPLTVNGEQISDYLIDAPLHTWKQPISQSARQHIIDHSAVINELLLTKIY